MEEEKDTTLTKRKQYERVKGTGSDKEIPTLISNDPPIQKEELLENGKANDYKNTTTVEINKVIPLFDNDDDDWGYLDAKP